MTEKDTIIIDKSQWPIVIVRYIGQPSDEAWDAHNAELSELMHNCRPFGVVADCTRTSPFPPKKRGEIADWLRAEIPAIEDWIAGVALYFTTAVQRGLLTAILWMVDVPVEMKVVANEEEALEHVRECLSHRITD